MSSLGSEIRGAELSGSGLSGSDPWGFDPFNPSRVPNDELPEDDFSDTHNEDPDMACLCEDCTGESELGGDFSSEDFSL